MLSTGSGVGGGTKRASILAVIALVTLGSVATVAATSMAAPPAIDHGSSDGAATAASDARSGPAQVENGSTANAEADGTFANQSVGASVATGDVDGDNATDALVGAPANGSNASQAYLFYGSDDGAANASVADAVFSTPGEDGATSTLTLADLNGDGTDEVGSVATNESANATVTDGGNATAEAGSIVGWSIENASVDALDEAVTENATVTDDATGDVIAAGDRTTDDDSDVTADSADADENVVTDQSSDAGSESADATESDGSDSQESTASEASENASDGGEGSGTSEALTVSTACTESNGTITVENPTDVALTVEVVGPGDYHEDPLVSAGESHRFTGLDDGSYDVTPYAALRDADVSGETVTIDCASEGDGSESENGSAEPDDGSESDNSGQSDDAGDAENGTSAPVGLDVSTQCASGSGAITVENPNDDRSLRAEVKGPDSYEETVLEPGETAEFDGLDNGTHDVYGVNPDTNVPISTETVTVGCANETAGDSGESEQSDGLRSASVSQQCGDAAIAAENPNDATLLVEVTGPDGGAEMALISAGESSEFDASAGGEYDVASYDVEGNAVGSESLTVDCASESAESTDGAEQTDENATSNDGATDDGTTSESGNETAADGTTAESTTEQTDGESTDGSDETDDTASTDTATDDGSDSATTSSGDSGDSATTSSDGSDDSAATESTEASGDSTGDATATPDGSTDETSENSTEATAGAPLIR